MPGGLKGLEKHYQGLSKRYGFTVVPSEDMVNALGYQFLGREEFDDAIEVFRYNVDLYPASANVYDSLGEALENSGKLEEAVKNYSKAAEHAAKIGDDRVGLFEANRDRAKAELEKRKQ